MPIDDFSDYEVAADLLWLMEELLHSALACSNAIIPRIWGTLGGAGSPPSTKKINSIEPGA